MKRNFLKYIVAVSILLSASACHDKLDLVPLNDVTSDVVYQTVGGYKQSLAKVYGSMAMGGGKGISDDTGADIKGIDQGASDFLRLYFNLQEVASDNAICAWVQDPGVSEINNLTWSSNNVILLGMYARSMYQITVANDFIRESADEKLAARGIVGEDADAVRAFRAEARFLRAFQYWVMMDLFGNPPFVTEENAIGKTPPTQISRGELFQYVESELLAVQEELVAPRQNEYGRADQAAAWMLLSKLYLNAEVYTGTGRYADALTYASRVINSAYTLKTNYAHLFLADNNIGQDEVILSINYDAIRTQNFGGTTFLVNSSSGAGMDMAALGIPRGGWGGNRSRRTLPAKFSDPSGRTDRRAMFFGENPAISDPSIFQQGLAVTKFKNIDRAGQAAPSNDGTQVSIDFPLMRLADAYLIYAEAVLRGGGGNMGEAINYVNEVRRRAYGNDSGNVSSIDLNFILDERAREFYWEGYRRTDLIRFGRYTGNAYSWPFKGGTAAGTSIPEFRSIYPLPASDVIANPNLTQNPGY
ncbi:RagB/SusD family nutrient uptake outer membrane protein [Sphingobacterium corticis]|uniref:RagB/SusD family nutrient uptake outer membrane protein n=1 Tax=Sphingobacterium corticis TaxID=1812823 RepID=A0ABW5NN11_9SPHI